MSQDPFAGIAQRGANLDRTSQLEAVPPFVPFGEETPIWPCAAPQESLSWSAPQRVSDAEALSKELERLRKWAQPFLKATDPAFPATRQELVLKDFAWKRVAPEDEGTFSEALTGGCSGWVQVQLPHYGGPTGRALAWYRSEFSLPTHFFAEGQSVWLCFGGADYKARVTVNGRCVGEHEGFFSPFEFEITRTAVPGQNTIFIELWNDGICMGYQSEPDGDKLYAATGLGWDEPGSGWHHCPPGMGLWRPVRIECRPRIFVRDVWVRPLPGLETAEIRLEVHNTSPATVSVQISVKVSPENFSTDQGQSIELPELPPAGPGTTLYRHVLSIPQARRWSPDSPWLYRVDVCLKSENQPQDAAARVFGMREFRMDENSEPKGRLFLNDTPIRLRGANTMGFEQQRVMAGDLEGLREDLLLAKACHMNFLRFTQRPVEREVYDLCDRLGIMAQSDLPLFGHLRRTQFCEGVRQAAEMARHTRQHACNILLTFINEPFPLSWGDKRHRQLDRQELEGFFLAATMAIRVEDPDVTIKPVDGDYDPPAAFGLPDSHIYTLWYNGHALAYGQLHQGAFPPTKKGWCFGCGEYGAEGLDFPDLMRRRYPAEWLPLPGEDAADWTPARICKAQSAAMQPLLFPKPSTLEEWCTVSQEHQRRATKDLTESFRRMDRMVSCAIHLFIDAWPAGWMKTIVDCERRPKPAFFALRDAYAPLLITPRSDRKFYRANESAECDVWICNDTPEPIPDCTLRWQIEDSEGRALLAGSAQTDVPACAPVCAGIIRWTVPPTSERFRMRIRVGLFNSANECLAVGENDWEVFPQLSAADWPPCTLLDAETDTPAGRLLRETGMSFQTQTEPDLSSRFAFSSHWPQESAVSDSWLGWVADGGTLVLYDLEPCLLSLPGGDVEIKRSGFWSALFVSCKTGHPIVADFAPDDFRYWFDARVGRIEPFLPTAVLAPDVWQGILATGFCEWGVPSVPAHAVCELRHGLGRIILCQLQLEGRIAANPPAEVFLRRLLQVDN